MCGPPPRSRKTPEVTARAMTKALRIAALGLLLTTTVGCQDQPLITSVDADVLDSRRDATAHGGAPGGGKLTICHKRGTRAERTMQVTKPSLRGHLGHGDVMGACGQTTAPRVIIETIPSSLALPAPGALWEIPVVIVRYIPTLDGAVVDAGEAGISGTLDQIRERIEVFEERVKFMLEEGSRFRGYHNPGAPYAIAYRVVHIVTVFSHFPRGREVPWNPGHYFPDYHQILGQIDAESWVNDRGVKEFWIWGYHSNVFEQPESNMSSPVTGDISNSARFADDLPVFNHTYTVYGYNFARTQAEAVHNHGHQLEAILSHVDAGLFWKEFVGRNADDTDF